MTDGEGLDSLGATKKTNLQALYNSTQNEVVRHRVTSLLYEYGDQRGSYIEPVYLDNSASKKEDENKIVDRPHRAASSITLSPNPADQYVILRWEWLEEGLKDVIVVRVYNSSGQVITEITIDDYMKNTQLVETDEWSSGLYTFKVYSEGLLLTTEKIEVL